MANTTKASRNAVYNIEASNSNVIVGDYNTVTIIQPNGIKYIKFSLACISDNQRCINIFKNIIY